MTQAELQTLAATAGDPDRSGELDGECERALEGRHGASEERKLQWPYDWVKGVDYPHPPARHSDRSDRAGGSTGTQGEFEEAAV